MKIKSSDPATLSLADLGNDPEGLFYIAPNPKEGYILKGGTAMAIWTGDLTEEQKTEADYLMSKVKNCKKLKEHAESDTERRRLDNEIHYLEDQINIVLNARNIYESLLAKAYMAVDAAEGWAKKYGLERRSGNSARQ